MISPQPHRRLSPLRIVGIYVFFSSLWILLSDRLLQGLVADPALLTDLQTVKGWAFVLLTSGFLYGLIQRSQQTLKDSYTLLASIIEGTSDAIFVKDRQGRYIMVNTVAGNILGRATTEVLGKTDWELLPPEAVPEIQAVDAAVMDSGETRTLEEVVPVADEDRIYWSTKYPWRDRQGQIRGLIGMARDVTDLVQVQRERQQLITELQQQTAELQALNLITANAISTLDLDALLQVLLDRIVSVTAADAALILLSDDPVLRVKASTGLAEANLSRYNGIAGESFLDTVFATGQPLYVEDIHQDLQFHHLANERPDQRSLLGFPLKREGRTLGVLKLIWNTIHPYQQREVHLLEITAERCTLAIINARLFAQMRQLKDQLQLQFERMPIGCILSDRHCRITDWNPAAEAIFGFSKAEALGRLPLELLFPASAQTQARLEFQRSRDGDSTRCSLSENITQQGRLIFCEWHNTPLRDAQGSFMGLLSMVQDVTERQKAEANLHRLAYYDTLTGLPRRQLLLNRIQQLIDDASERAGLFAVLALDIERIKVIKYSLSHEVADHLVVAITHRLEACLQPPVVLARLEADEFVVLLENLTDLHEVNRWADLIQREMARPFAIHNYRLFVTVRVGISLSNHDFTQASDMLRAADTAMHRAAVMDNDRVVFDRAMQQRAIAQIQLEGDLRQALDHHELEVYYQPIVALETQRLVGFEALVRWHHPQQGMVSPNDFIPLAEQTGLILPLGYWVLQQACRQMQQWQQEFDRPSLALSVNLSVIQLRQMSLFSQIKRLLQSTAFASQNLKLEITESAVMENSQWALEVLEGLTSQSISLVIDDFGTGYSSLSYLHEFPFDTLKIDRSFVSRLCPGTLSFEIIRTIITLARSLNLKVVAEGIETRQQLDCLMELGCDLGQGYLFSPPLNADQAATLIGSES